VTDGAAPVPPGEINGAPARPSGTASLDGWLLNKLFGR